MKPQKGAMIYFKVQVVEEPDTWLTIATTRPETIPGDAAVAVNPKDERYAHLIGKHVRRALPLENQAAIPIVGDDHVDFEFGTKALELESGAALNEPTTYAVRVAIAGSL